MLRYGMRCSSALRVAGRHGPGLPACSSSRGRGGPSASTASAWACVAVCRAPPLARSPFSISGARRSPSVGDSQQGTPASAESGKQLPVASSAPSAAPRTPLPAGPPSPAAEGLLDDSDFPPPRPSPSAPRRLSQAVAQRILAPQLRPLAEQSPWQAARDDILAGEWGDAVGEREEVTPGSSVASPPSSSSGSPKGLVPLRRPYAFLRRLSHHWLHRLTTLLQYGLGSEGNTVRLYFDGDDAFSDMFAAIEAAQDRVCLETFMWKPDRIGLRMIELLEQAAERGCQVLVLYDAAGSFSLRSSHLAKLAAMPTAHVVAFNPVLAALFRVTQKDFSHRTHRKILIADNVAFAGGMNTSEQYAGPRMGINEFRDTHARISGPAVEHLAEVFEQSLQEAHAHDRETWRKLLKSIRTRTTARITQSSLFQRALDILAESGTSTGEKAGKFFAAARERQQARLAALQSEEQAMRDAAARKAQDAAAVHATRSTTHPVPAPPSERPSLFLSPYRRQQPRPDLPTARASLRRIRGFVGARLRVLAQSSSSSQQYRQFEEVTRQAGLQWREAWRSIQRASRTARRAGGADPTQMAQNGDTGAAEPADPEQNEPNDEEPTPLHPSLPSSALSSLTASLTSSSVPPPKHGAVTAQSGALAQPGSAAPSSASSSSASSSSSPSSPSSPPSSAPDFPNVFLQILPSNTIRGQYQIQHALLDVLDAASHYVLITNPFLLPPRGIAEALLRAGARGVTVKLLLGGKSDTPFMRWSSTHLYHRFLAHPCISIYEYQPRILHAKTLTCDGLLSSVGSYNLDFLSAHKLLEVNMAMVSATMARRMEEQFDEDIRHCVRVTRESLKQRNVAEKMLHWAAYHASRIVYSFLK